MCFVWYFVNMSLLDEEYLSFEACFACIIYMYMTGEVYLSVPVRTQAEHRVLILQICPDGQRLCLYKYTVLVFQNCPDFSTCVLILFEF